MDFMRRASVPGFPLVVAKYCVSLSDAESACWL